MLIEVGKRLLQIVRTGDTVARLGGDEFVLLMLDLDNKQHLEQILQRIIKGVSEPIAVFETTAIVSASIGITFFPNDNNVDKLLHHADQAMYQAKQGGKNRYAFFDSLSVSENKLEEYS